MRLVLAGLDGKHLHGALRDRQGHNYPEVNFRGTMMSHAPSLPPQLSLPIAVVFSAKGALLVHPRRLAQLSRPRFVPARIRAVPVPAIAAATQEEDVSARAADDAK